MLAPHFCRGGGRHHFFLASPLPREKQSATVEAAAYLRSDRESQTERDCAIKDRSSALAFYPVVVLAGVNFLQREKPSQTRTHMRVYRTDGHGSDVKVGKKGEGEGASAKRGRREKRKVSRHREGQLEGTRTKRTWGRTKKVHTQKRREAEDGVYDASDDRRPELEQSRHYY